ncbi:hypothetical protein Tco_1215803 [Tanacetum coccineum]
METESQASFSIGKETGELVVMETIRMDDMDFFEMVNHFFNHEREVIQNPLAPERGAAPEALPQALAPKEVAHPAPDQKEREREAVRALSGNDRNLVQCREGDNVLRSGDLRGDGYRNPPQMDREYKGDPNLLKLVIREYRPNERWAARGQYRPWPGGGAPLDVGFFAGNENADPADMGAAEQHQNIARREWDELRLSREWISVENHFARCDRKIDAIFEKARSMYRDGHLALDIEDESDIKRGLDAYFSGIPPLAAFVANTIVSSPLWVVAVLPTPWRLPDYCTRSSTDVLPAVVGTTQPGRVSIQKEKGQKLGKNDEVHPNRPIKNKRRAKRQWRAKRMRNGHEEKEGSLEKKQLSSFPSLPGPKACSPFWQIRIGASCYATSL